MKISLRPSLALVLQLLFVGLFSSLTVVASSAPAHACSCVTFELANSVEQSAVVLTGTPVAWDAGDRESLNGGTITVEVEKVYKGEVPSTVYVKTASNGAACGWNPELNTRTNLFLYKEEGAYSTNLCSGNHPATEASTAKLVALVGEGHAPEEGTMGTPPATGPGTMELVGLGLLGALAIAVTARIGYLVWRRKRA